MCPYLNYSEKESGSWLEREELGRVKIISFYCRRYLLSEILEVLVPGG